MAETHIIAKEGCCFTPQSLRLLNRAIACEEGISFDGAYVGAPLFVAAEGAGRNVRVNPGSAFIEGDRFVGEGMYFVSNDAPVILSIPPGDAADPRCDLIVAQIPESGTGCWELAVVQGIPSPQPLCPAVPDSALVLAEVISPAGAGTIDQDDIQDMREAYQTCTGEGNWRSYSPSYNTGNITTIEARYTTIGNTVMVRVRANASSMPTNITVTTPVLGRSMAGWTTGMGTASAQLDVASGANVKTGIVVPSGSGLVDDITVIAPRWVDNPTDELTANVNYRAWGPGFPFAWQEGSSFGLQFYYEAAP